MFQTRLELGRAMLAPGRGWPPALAREITSHPYLVVIDEVHKHRAMVEALSTVFHDSDGVGRTAIECRLSTPFRSPARGRRSWPKWLLLSATPINPVSLDAVDPFDGRTGEEAYDGASSEERDENLLVSSVEKIHGTLAELAGERYGEWFEQHVAAVRAGLHDAGEESLELPAQLSVWPPTVRIPALMPEGEPRWVAKPPTPDPVVIARALDQLVHVAQAIGGTPVAPAEQPRRWASAERFALSGGLLRTSKSSIQGQHYSGGLANSVRAAVKRLRADGVEVPEKPRALREFIAAVGSEHVLVFCVHRAVARAVVEILAAQRPDGTVRAAIGDVGERDSDWFNDRSSKECRILVATDACSESIDLHERADILVHYELPWSPLRVMQRVGRLWRLRTLEAGTKPKPPRLPGVVHFAHPGGVDEEILSRLQRRWGYLRTLGLDYLSYDQAMGIRLPRVPWAAARTRQG
jgi:hypothetical protein